MKPGIFESPGKVSERRCWTYSSACSGLATPRQWREIMLSPSLRLSIVGFGTVGRWLADAIGRHRSWLEAEHGVAVTIVGVANRRDGFVYRDAGFDITTLLELVSAGRPLREYPGGQRWETALEGLAQTECEVMAEASSTDPREPEPALSHIRQALGRGTHVITSSKGACAAAAVELLELAKRRRVQCRMESTVMSGTPVLSTIREGLAGAHIAAVRGILNGTANHILTLMAEGLAYPAALADAQARGYAESDPTDDVEGHDVVAKARILGAIAFNRSVTLDQVIRRGITDITREAVQHAARRGCRIKLMATVRRRPGDSSAPLEARVEPLDLPLTDPLSHVDGVMNALAIETDPVREVTIMGPGAGPEQAGQGMFADLVAVARSHHGGGAASSFT
jgi:homoserine dehydrogenase